MHPSSTMKVTAFVSLPRRYHNRQQNDKLVINYGTGCFVVKDSCRTASMKSAAIEDRRAQNSLLQPTDEIVRTCMDRTYIIQTPVDLLNHPRKGAVHLSTRHH